MTGKSVLVATFVAIVAAFAGSAAAVTVNTIADAQLSENGVNSMSPTPATNDGTGVSPNSINVRWNFGSNMDRNEWGAYKFDLSSVEDKSVVQNVTFNTYMHRGNTNNSGKTLHLYAITPGTPGEDWPEASVVYGTMPGFTWDDNASTNVLAVGPGMALTDLGTFLTAGLDAEGSLATVAPRLGGQDILTPMVQGMGSNNLLTILITYQNNSNGTWNTMTRESQNSLESVLIGDAGDFASFLDFSIGTGGVLGDYNNNGTVDAADYVLWRNGGPLQNEGDLPGTFNQADYDFWRSRFGATSGSGSGVSGVAIPEPSTVALFWISATAMLLVRRHGAGGSR